MKRSPIETYMGSLHEGIAEKIIKMLLLHRMKPLLAKAEKELDDPEFTAQLDTIRYAVDDFEKRLKNWCKYKPDDFRCKDKKF